MIGLTSVTFRKLPPEKIIALACEAGLDGIEWGGDVHVAPGDNNNARHIGEITRCAGLQVLSYGSYYRLGENADIGSSFRPVLESAKALGADNIRVWAGARSPKKADDDYYSCAALDWQTICDMADDVKISVEYHRNTLTEDADSALRLIELCGRGNMATYWQPNPDISHGANAEELRRIIPYLSNIHVFHWKNSMRLPLSEGADEWSEYLQILRGEVERSYILEFVADDSEENFRVDAQTLKRWIEVPI